MYETCLNLCKCNTVAKTSEMWRTTLLVNYTELYIEESEKLIKSKLFSTAHYKYGFVTIYIDTLTVTETDRHTDRQTDRQRDRQTDILELFALNLLLHLFDLSTHWLQLRRCRVNIPLQYFQLHSTINVIITITITITITILVVIVVVVVVIICWLVLNSRLQTVGQVCTALWPFQNLTVLQNPQEPCNYGHKLSLCGPQTC